jgi:hypothetical protein
MMENNKTSAGSGLLAGLGGGAGGGLQGLSPYLNIDPSYLQSAAPEYLFDQEARRGKVRPGIGRSAQLVQYMW